MLFDLIVAVDENNGIGKNGVIPWDCASDRAFFAKQTSKAPAGKKNALIMGRVTRESIGKDLPKRINIVVSHSSLSLTDALTQCSVNPEIHRVYVIGGAELYAEALKSSFLHRIYITRIPGNYECDRFINIEGNYRGIKRIDLDSKAFVEKLVLFNSEENNYLEIGRELLLEDPRQTRNAKTLSSFGKSLSFNLSRFPLLTSKKMPLRLVFEELMWFLRGQTDSKILESKGVNIWKENSSLEFIEKCGLPYREGDIGNMYGFQLRHFGEEYQGCKDSDVSQYQGFDQLKYCLDLLKNDKHSRRIIMSTFDPSRARQGVLYPCHGISIQFYVKEKDGINEISCSMYQRSADWFLGLPFNIASYSLLVYLICATLSDTEKYVPGNLHIFLGDVHIYCDHLEAVYKQFENFSKRPYQSFPLLRINRKENIENYEYEDLQLINYKPAGIIKAPMIA